MKKRFGSLGKRLATALCAAALACGMAALVACGGSSSTASTDAGSGEEQVQLQIFAANSLEKAMPQVQELYTQQHPNVTFADSQFKASGDLVEEIEAGAKTDILITASKSTMDDAEGYIDRASRVTMFGNDLEICAPKDSKLKIKSLKDVASPKVGKIAIGDAELVPAGKYANQSLASMEAGYLYSSSEGEGGSYDKSIAKKVVLANQVGTCAQWAASGSVDIAFIYTSDLYRYSGVKSIYTVPEETHKPITYPGAVIADSANHDAASDFLDFCMTDPDALAIWQDNGFELK